MAEPSDIREMLDELRFDEAESLLAQSESDPDPEMFHEIATRRAEAEERATEMAERIVGLGEERELEEIVALAHDPGTRRLLRLLSDAYRKRPELYLREAERWEEKKEETNSRRLTEARKALDGLDLELASGLMNRIDGRFLTPEQNEERDQLILDISARSMELESLNETGNQLARNRSSKRRTGQRKPWWRRWLG